MQENAIEVESMNVSLTNELETLVREKVRSGLYHSASEVIREGLRLLKQRDQLREMRLAELRKEIAVGIEQADRGEVIRCDTDEELQQLLGDVKARGRQRRAKGKTT
jgi:antitoxin ParD1/3/4